MNDNIQALQALYVTLGGDAADVANISTNPDMIAAIAGVVGIKDVIVAPEAQSSSLFDTLVSAMQSDLAVVGNTIIGTLKYISTGSLADVWGAGNFMALKFVDTNTDAAVKIGMDPSVSSGFVALDEDMNAVVKVTDKDAQVFKVITTVNGISKTQTFYLNGLILEEA